eukprot:gene5251-biopygen2310
MLANAASMILTGFLMTVDPDRKWLYLAISTVNFFLVPAIVTAMDEADKTSVRSVSFDGTMSIDDANLYIVSLQRRWRRQIFDRFFLVCGFFPAVFGLQACGVISRDVGIASFLVGSLLGKLVFSSVFAQSYLALSLEMSTVSHSIVRSHETRRSFLRYVFHELRVPLHTLTMGMPLLLDLVGPRESLSAENAQLIDMVHASTASLVDNMSQVLTLHRLREGEIPCQPTVLRLDQLLMDELYRAQEQMHVLNGLSLSLSCASSLSSASVTQDGTESALYVEGSEEHLRILVQGVLGALGGCVKSVTRMREMLEAHEDALRTADLRHQNGIGLGFVLAMENGWEAVLLMREDIRRFDIVFMDYTMPVMTGSDATRILREELHYEGYVIGVTGNVLPDDMSRFVASGANLVLLKPLRSPDLDLVLGYIAGHGLQCDLTRRLCIDSVQRVVMAEPYVNQGDE